MGRPAPTMKAVVLLAVLAAVVLCVDDASAKSATNVAPVGSGTPAPANSTGAAPGHPMKNKPLGKPLTNSTRSPKPSANGKKRKGMQRKKPTPSAVQSNNRIKATRWQKKSSSNKPQMKNKARRQKGKWQKRMLPKKMKMKKMNKKPRGG